MGEEIYYTSKNAKKYYATAKLIATHVLSLNPRYSSAYSDSSKNTNLFVYEFEHNGKMYKYRKIDNSAPKTIDLCFDDPNNVYRLELSESNTDSTNSRPTKKSKAIVWIILIISIIFIVCTFSSVFENLKDIDHPIYKENIPYILIFIIFIIIINVMTHKKQKWPTKLQERLEKLENAILNNHVAIANLKRWYSRTHGDNIRPGGTIYDTWEYQYCGIYKYNYNGRTYRYKGYFREIPEKQIKLFFGKNPKDIIYTIDE